jgi:hypothetical protein
MLKAAKLPNEGSGGSTFWHGVERGLVSRLSRALAILLLVVAAGGAARGQSIGYVPNATDGTVTIFGTTYISTPSGLADSALQTVTVGKNPSSVAVTPDSKHAYVTCSGDNSLWSIDVTNLSQGAAVSQNVTGSLQLSSPSGIGIANPTTGSNSGKTLAYVVNSKTNSVSVINTSNNMLYDGPIQLGTPGTGSAPPALLAVAPDSSKVFVATNNPTPQLWMIDTTSPTPETTTQILATGFPIPTATGSVYLSVQQNSSSGDYYVFLTTSTPSPAKPSLYLIDVEPATPAKDTSTVVLLGSTAEPNHIASQPISSSTANLFSVYTVDSNDTLWQVNFDCSANASKCTTATAKCTTSAACEASTSISVPSGGVLNGVALTITSNALQALGQLQYIYLTDGLSTSPLLSVVVDPTTGIVSSPASPPSSVQVGNGSDNPAFSEVSASSPAIVFFTSLSPNPAKVGTLNRVNASGASIVNPQNTTSVDLSFGVKANYICDTMTTPCPSGTATSAAGVGGNSTFPASGVDPITLVGTQGSTTTTVTQSLNVGANCTLNLPPATVLAGQQAEADLLCTAPTDDVLLPSVTWDDNSTPPPPSSVTVTPGTSVTIKLLHTYNAPSPAGGYTVSVSLSDTTESVSGTVSPSSGTIVVTAPSCATFSVTPSPALQYSTFAATLTCAGAPNDTLSGTLSWGDGTSASTSAVVSSSGSATLSFPTHTYSGQAKVDSVTVTTVKDTTLNLNATVTANPVSVTVGLACALSEMPADAAVGATVTATLNCTAPPQDSITGTVNWGDGSSNSSGTASANSSGAAVLTFAHPYSTAKTYSINVTATDTTAALPVTVSPASVVVAAPPTCTLNAPTAAQISTSVTVTLACTAPANDALGATVSWGDGTAASIANVTANSSGSATLSLTHTYTALSNPTDSIGATVTDTTTTLAATVSPASVAITISTLAPPVCTVSATPTKLQAGQTVTATLACTAPAGDSLSGTVTWGDGSSNSTSTATATGGSASLSFTHTYASVSNPTDSLSATVTDTTTKLAGTVSPASISITVTPPAPSCSLSATPTKVEAGQSVAATLTCAAQANDSLSGTVNWGDGTGNSTTTGTATGGSATLSFTHTYATASNPTDSLSATVTDATATLTGTVSPASVAITVLVIPAVTTPQSSVSGTPGQAVNVSTSFAGGAAEAGVVFSTITCTVTPTAPCTPSSSTLTLDANGNGTLTFTVTPPATAISVRVPGSRMPRTPLWAFIILLCGVGLVYLGVSISAGQRRRWTWSLALLLLMIPTLLAMEACGGGSSSTSTPSGSSVTYTASVQAQSTATATLPAIKASGGFTVTVQYP